MYDLQLSKTRITGGIWEGVLSIPDTRQDLPVLEVTHLGVVLDGHDLTPAGDGKWLFRFAIPADLLAEGIQTFVISEKGSGETLASFSILTGAPLEDDLRAEVNLLRAELDMLKRAFRRHATENPQ